MTHTNIVSDGDILTLLTAAENLRKQDVHEKKTKEN